MHIPPDHVLVAKYDRADDCTAAWDALVASGVNPDDLSTYWLHGQFWLVRYAPSR